MKSRENSFEIRGKSPNLLDIPIFCPGPPQPLPPSNRFSCQLQVAQLFTGLQTETLVEDLVVGLGSETQKSGVHWWIWYSQMHIYLSIDQSICMLQIVNPNPSSYSGDGVHILQKIYTCICKLYIYMWRWVMRNLQEWNWAIKQLLGSYLY